MTIPLGWRILLVASLAVFALALDHFLLHWVLYADATMRRFLY